MNDPRPPPTRPMRSLRLSGALTAMVRILWWKIVSASLSAFGREQRAEFEFVQRLGGRRALADRQVQRATGWLEDHRLQCGVALVGRVKMGLDFRQPQFVEYTALLERVVPPALHFLG